MVEQRLQVLEVEQQQAFAVRDFERGIQRRLLTVGQFQNTADQQRSHFAQGGAQRMTGLTGNVPQRDRVGLGFVVQPGHAGDALGDLALRVAGSTEPAQVTFDVGREHRHTGIAEGFCQTLQGNGLAGTGSTRDQPMSVCQTHGLGDRLPCKVGTDNEFR